MDKLKPRAMMLSCSWSYSDHRLNMSQWCGGLAKKVDVSLDCLGRSVKLKMCVIIVPISSASVRPQLQ